MEINATTYLNTRTKVLLLIRHRINTASKVARADVATIPDSVNKTKKQMAYYIMYCDLHVHKFVHNMHA